MGRGGPWMFQWTSLSHFDRRDEASKQHENVFGKLEPFVFILDTGKQDADFDRLGIEKPDIEEMRAILKGIGYEIEYKGGQAAERLIEKGLCTAEDFNEVKKLIGWRK